MANMENLALVVPEGVDKGLAERALWDGVQDTRLDSLKRGYQEALERKSREVERLESSDGVKAYNNWEWWKRKSFLGGFVTGFVGFASSLFAKGVYAQRNKNRKEGELGNLYREKYPSSQREGEEES